MRAVTINFVETPISRFLLSCQCCVGAFVSAVVGAVVSVVSSVNTVIGYVVGGGGVVALIGACDCQ